MPNTTGDKELDDTINKFASNVDWLSKELIAVKEQNMFLRKLCGFLGGLIVGHLAYQVFAYFF